VFVLLPGGTFWMGAQKDDPNGRNHDPNAGESEGPVHEVTLSAFFLSKFEMTQGQWERFSGSNPCFYDSERYSRGWNRGGEGWSALHPVEQVSWIDCTATMERLGLSLPTEAQWEYGARAGTDTPWWPGEDASLLAPAANLSDQFAKGHGGPFKAWDPWDDDNTCHAPVGEYRANAFGLLDVLGNVWEWCLDGFDTGSYDERATDDPVFPPGASSSRVFRGGGFESTAVRSALGVPPRPHAVVRELRPRHPSRQDHRALGRHASALRIELTRSHFPSTKATPGWPCAAGRSDLLDWPGRTPLPSLESSTPCRKSSQSCRCRWTASSPTAMAAWPRCSTGTFRATSWSGPAARTP